MVTTVNNNELNLLGEALKSIIRDSVSQALKEFSATTMAPPKKRRYIHGYRAIMSELNLGRTTVAKMVGPNGILGDIVEKNGPGGQIMIDVDEMHRRLAQGK